MHFSYKGYKCTLQVDKNNQICGGDTQYLELLRGNPAKIAINKLRNILE